MKALRLKPGHLIARIRARQEHAAWRRQGKRVVEVRGLRRTAVQRRSDRLSLPVVFVGSETSQRTFMRANWRNGLPLR